MLLGLVQGNQMSYGHLGPIVVVDVMATWQSTCTVGHVPVGAPAAFDQTWGDSPVS